MGISLFLREGFALPVSPRKRPYGRLRSSPPRRAKLCLRLRPQRSWRKAKRDGALERWKPFLNFLLPPLRTTELESVTSGIQIPRSTSWATPCYFCYIIYLLRRRVLSCFQQPSFFERWKARSPSATRTLYSARPFGTHNNNESAA